MTRSNSQLFILVFLGILTAFGPFVTDMYLPTLPAMTDYFHTTSSQVQLGLTASMIGLAVGQLFFGPLSDKYGRRLPLIVAMCLFLLATLGCLYSRTIMQFVGWRVVQGIAGAGGIVISRSAVFFIHRKDDLTIRITQESVSLIFQDFLFLTKTI